MGSPALGESHIPMSSRTQGISATLPSIGTGHRDDVAGEASPHGTVGFHAHRAVSEEAGVSATAHDDLRHRLDAQCERLNRVKNHLRSLDQALQRV